MARRSFQSGAKTTDLLLKQRFFLYPYFFFIGGLMLTAYMDEVF